MSLTSLAKKEIIRQEQPTPKKLRFDDVFSSVRQFSSEEPSPEDSQPSQSPEQTQDSHVLDGLVKYIPTESVTLYVAACSAMDSLKSVFSFINEERVYWFFAILTPVLFLLIYAGERRSKNKKLTPLPRWENLPWWKLIASTTAFLAWALAVPNSPYLHGNEPNTAGGAVAALLALFVSTILSLLEPVFEP